MTKPNDEWKVLPHGKLVPLDDNLFTVTGQLHMPLGDFERRMTVARLERGELVLYSAIALDEVEMRALESLGTPAYLVVPSAAHRLDVKPYKDRYPQLRVITPEGARDRVCEVCAVDGSTADFGDPRVQLFTVPGTDEHECALLVQSSGGSTLVLNDLLFNNQSEPGAHGWLMEKLGFTGQEPHIPWFAKLAEVKDKSVLARALRDWAHIPALRRIVVSHGRVIEHDAAQVLEHVAHDLAA